MRSYRKKIYSRYKTFFNKSVSIGKHNHLKSCKILSRHFREWLPDNKKAFILDAGCGYGKLLQVLSTKGYSNVYGVDISPEQVEVAKQSGVGASRGDVIDYLESHKNTYDLITGIDIIEHFDKQEVLLFLDACFMALRSGGRLILQTPNAASPWGMMYRYGDFTHETSFTPELLKNLLVMHGFSNIEYREAGPVASGLFSIIRFVVWRVIWMILASWNLIEIGNLGTGIYTRVFLASGVK